MDKTPIIPVYLNQTNVFDMVAMLSGGIAKVTNVNTVTAADKSDLSEVAGGFGLGPALSSLFSVNLNAREQLDSSLSEKKEVGEERIHTPASLLFRLRELLETGGSLTKVDGASLPQPGSIVEIEVVLSKSPVVEFLDAAIELIKMAKFFETPQPARKGGGNNPSQSEQIIRQLSALNESLKLGNSLDLIGHPTIGEYQTVITLDRTFLKDPFMMDLIDGQFKILGKVVRTTSAADAPIGLLRKTAIDKAPEVVAELVKALGAINSGGMFNMPDVSIAVDGPALQIIPIAIYA